jgi:hypothetical protein
MIPFKYKIECQCGECNKELITGYGDLRNVYNSIKNGVLRSVPYPYFGFLTKRAVDGFRRWWAVQSYKLSVTLAYVRWLIRRR